MSAGTSLSFDEAVEPVEREASAHRLLDPWTSREIVFVHPRGSDAKLSRDSLDVKWPNLQRDRIYAPHAVGSIRRRCVHWLRRSRRGWTRPPRPGETVPM